MAAVIAPSNAFRCKSPSPLEGRVARDCVQRLPVDGSPVGCPPSQPAPCRRQCRRLEHWPEGVTSVWSLQRQRAPPWAPFAAVRLGPPRYFLRLTRSQFLATRSRLSAVTLSLPEPQLMRSRLPSRAVMVSLPRAARDHVAARAAADLVLAALAAQCVVAAAAGQGVLAGAAGDGVAPAAAGEPVGAGVAADAVVAALAAHAVVAGVAAQRVVARAAEDAVAARAAGDAVGGAGRAAAVAVDDVVVGAGVDDVLAAEAVDGVVATEALDVVGRRGAVDLVGPWRAGEVRGQATVAASSTSTAVMVPSRVFLRSKLPSPLESVICYEAPRGPAMALDRRVNRRPPASTPTYCRNKLDKA